MTFPSECERTTRPTQGDHTLGLPGGLPRPSTDILSVLCEMSSCSWPPLLLCVSTAEAQTRRAVPRSAGRRVAARPPADRRARLGRRGGHPSRGQCADLQRRRRGQNDWHADGPGALRTPIRGNLQETGVTSLISTAAQRNLVCRTRCTPFAHLRADARLAHRRSGFSCNTGLTIWHA